MLIFVIFAAEFRTRAYNVAARNDVLYAFYLRNSNFATLNTQHEDKIHNTFRTD